MRKVQSTPDDSAPTIQDVRDALQETERKLISQDGAVDVPRADGWRASPVNEISPVYRRSLFRR